MNIELSMSRKSSERIFLMLAFGFMLFVIGGISWQMTMFHLTCRKLATLHPQDVEKLIIHPGEELEVPLRAPIEFVAPDPMLDDFVKYVKDIRFSWTGSTPVANPYGESWWSMDVILTGGEVIEMGGFIPAKSPNAVHGFLDNLAHYKSQQLFTWYRMYRHRWLQQPAPSAPSQ